jgi:hypothetical protein
MDTIKVNNKTYRIVNDLVVDNSDDIQSQSENNFISGSIAINDKNYSFINNYDSITGDNCIGLWQTILLNANFNYTDDFAYRFIIADNKHYISFNLSNNELKTSINNRFISESDYELVDIEDIIQEVTQVVIIKTPSQIQFEKRKKLKLIIEINIIVWAFLALLYGVYYMLNIDQKVALEDELKEYNQVNTIIHNQIVKKQEQLVKTNNNQIIVSHVDFLLALKNADITMQTTTDQSANTNTLTITVSTKDSTVLRHLATKHNYQINNIKRDVKKQTAVVNLGVKSDK